MVEWLWDHHVVAVASDTAGVEALSPDPEFFLHLALLPLLGMPLGEFWVLDALARDCANDGQYACLLVSSRSISGAGSALHPRRSRSSRPSMARASPLDTDTEPGDPAPGPG
jgi:hypothetical protein